MSRIPASVWLAAFGAAARAGEAVTFIIVDSTTNVRSRATDLAAQLLTGRHRTYPE